MEHATVALLGLFLMMTTYFFTGQFSADNKNSPMSEKNFFFNLSRTRLVTWLTMHLGRSSNAKIACKCEKNVKIK